MAGRITSDPKETTLKLRLNEIMRKYVEKQAQRQGCSMSEYLRILIKKDMRNSQS